MFLLENKETRKDKKEYGEMQQYPNMKAFALILLTREPKATG
jgi:hypothetical protein